MTTAIHYWDRAIEIAICGVDTLRHGLPAHARWDEVTCAACLAHRPVEHPLCPSCNDAFVPSGGVCACGFVAPKAAPPAPPPPQPWAVKIEHPPARCKPGCTPAAPCNTWLVCPAFNEVVVSGHMKADKRSKGIDADPKPRRFAPPELRCAAVLGLRMQ